MKIHEKYIKRCIDLAKNGLPSAMPNPSVGALLLVDNRIIAEGYTSAYGGPHAEVNAITYAQTHSPELLQKATLYVTLEPCSHYGKTPPCADLVVASGIKKVVIGTTDPFAKVAGNGIKKLMEAGIDVTVGILESECYEVNKRFFTYHEKKRPYILLKWAETLDGYIAPAQRDKTAPVWITNLYSRQLVHKWRSEEQAILVGANTVLADNPSLTTRDWYGTSPLRVVLNERNELPKDASIFNDQAETIVIASQDPNEVIEILYKKGIQSIIIEGGAKTLQHFIDAGIWDEARVFTGKTTFENGMKAPVFHTQHYTATTQDIKGDILTTYKNKTT
ncbi:bifunctional diaminohydroxyphosphoribosylaminopyrimidine deaminase/5-amino-6-(5-phosphoribosylamino)uracil reductase RibD [uncultured Dokdonia sp.]|uniref:bifunctional diaminohydroxyphosphoribosylaminopyrimidine deaminase/5-amino-6-(5-phosphoribosylamino)uracil reductase RibD n=1 Tax=uncultured Dokdonia sp. TaxID=575653 RepID=UPI00262ED05D|nr:bifunctional diaminohydroxyphosphoribosylaminopyrimidine deaminase/5-amino-6-(5-phosphoribosylamino)uracil reductase RibD [uncultured Dokdonia sp.]